VLHSREETITPAHLPEEFQAGILSPSPTAAVTSPSMKAAAAGVLLPLLPPPPGEPATLAAAVDACERRLIEHALQRAHGVQTGAAELLGTTRRILKYKMEKLGIGTQDASVGQRVSGPVRQ